MKIQDEFEVFDHPDYCTTEGMANDYERHDQWCHYYYARDCELYRDKEGVMIPLKVVDKTAIKCDQCKAAYQNVKAIKIAEEHKSGIRTAVSQEELDALLGDGFVELGEE